ncbi:uncharacterized protein LOC132197790 [Neocloeon triangulifer]|uniref:uncharacterized protein LOC132197790 n=1 Tax=Neocloeon triangulifer TaxID=2078957 RepID=UPI00286F6B2E|nr:uncharacterized protein LOC132197790 [Neocloeon triangulifer]
MARGKKGKRKASSLIADDIGPILSGKPMTLDQMVRVCQLITKSSRIKAFCLDAPPAKWKVGRRPHLFLVLNNGTRWICCYNDGKTTITQFNTNDLTDTTALSTRLLQAYNLQPFELKQAIVKSDIPLPSSDADSGYVAIAAAAQLATKQKPTQIDPNDIRRNTVRMLYRSKLNGFPDYSDLKGCKKKPVVAPEEVLFRNLFDAYDMLNDLTKPPSTVPADFYVEEVPAAPAPIHSQPAPLQPLTSATASRPQIEEARKLTIAEPLIEYPDEDVQMIELPAGAQRIITYEAGPNASAVSVATRGILDKNNIKFVQYERITREIHYIKPKSSQGSSK